MVLPWSIAIESLGKPVTCKGKIAAGTIAGKVELFREMSDFRRAGEIESLSIGSVNDELVVLNNRRTQIVLDFFQIINVIRIPTVLFQTFFKCSCHTGK